MARWLVGKPRRADRADPQLSYGDYLLAKVGKVFAELRQQAMCSRAFTRGP